MYRNPKLRRWAAGQPCTIHGPWCDGGGETSVWAHSNESRHGKGMGLKAHDLFGCVACAPCHRWLDEGQETRQAKRERFLQAWEESMIAALNAGVLG